MIFVRTALGALLVACLVALAGLGYRLWEVQRQLGVRVKALEAQVTSTQADMGALRASFDQRVAAPAREEGVETEEVAEVEPETR